MLQVPRANLHVPIVLVQAASQALGRRLAALLSPAVVLVSILLALGLGRERVVVLLAFALDATAAGAASEHAPDGMPDR